MKLNELLGIKYPLIQGGMANIATGEFAAAISNAGGLGLIASGSMNGEAVREQIRACRAKTDKPFGVNIMMMNQHLEEISQVVIEEKVPVVTTGAGNPGKYITTWKEAGIKVLPVAPTVALAKRLERNGDAVIVEGTEAGGHVGDLTTMALVPQVVDALSIPVIAAGGIASGRQVLAAFALGACGVQVGTCLLVSEECPIHENYKNAVLKAGDTDTVVTGKISGGAPVRCIKNKMTREYVAKERAGATPADLEEYTLGSLRRSVFEGDTSNGSLMAGQVAGMCNEIKPAKEIIEKLFEDCKTAYENLGR